MVLREVVPAGLIVIAAVLLVRGLTPYGTATTPDSERYLDVAANVRAGRGVVLTDPGAATGVRPFTTYPPLYPVALSAFVGEGERPEQSAATLGAVALAVAGLLFYALLRPLGGRLGALVGAGTFLSSAPTLTLYGHAWSEALAVPLLLAAAWLAARGMQAAANGFARPRATCLLLLALALGALVWCRYIGVLFCALLPLGWLAAPERRRWLGDHLAATAAVVGSAGALALRNVRLTGHLSGAWREPETAGVRESLAALADALSIQFSRHPAALAVAALLGAAAAAASWFRARSNAVGAEERVSESAWHAQAYRLGAIATVGLAAYYGGLVVIRSVRRLDELDTRFVGLGFPLLVAALWLGAWRGWRRRARTASRIAITAVSVALLALLVARGLGLRREVASAWAACASPPYPLASEGFYTNYNPPERAYVEPAAKLIEAGRYDAALVELQRAPAACADGYVLSKALATVHAGLGRVEDSLAYTRRCLALDPARTRDDTVAIATPFWQEPSRYRAGIRYYEALVRDMPDAWWLCENLGTLARRVGELEHAREWSARAAEIKARVASHAPSGERGAAR
jgi:tetratricopeptide (TPR) repeat protein